ncbi:MAG: hypothetical protein WA214_00145, partial [Pseudolabrys sp.]
RRGWSRHRATAASALACWLCGLATVLSFNQWATWFPLAAITIFADATVYYLLDHLTSNIMLPFGGFTLALFAGWKLPARLFAEEIGIGLRSACILQFMLRYVIPTCIAIVALFPLFGAK